ncbi:MAG: hypothetical protein GF316_08245 [Candidatus Lokiarchaeota archaeon]|nr:hypothetical protein [Candidatus Lokiarchaeota archaeon]
MKIREINKNSEIIKYLSLGTSMPVWRSLREFIKYDFEIFNPKLLLLLENGYPSGIVLIFIQKNILYFGYFKVMNDREEKIDFLINQINQYARKYQCNLIRGPINIPVIIYGWGFMESGSQDSLCSTKPVNSKGYLIRFLDNNYKITSRHLTWETFPARYFDPMDLQKYSYKDYRYFNPLSRNEFLELKKDFIMLQHKNLPDSAQITPNSSQMVENYFDFIMKFGHLSMVFFVEYIPDNKNVACGAFIPDPFRKDEKGNNDSFCIYSWVVDKAHRRKGLLNLMYGNTILQIWEKGMRNCFGTIAESNYNSTMAAKRLYGEKTRSHVILEKKV